MDWEKNTKTGLKLCRIGRLGEAILTQGIEIAYHRKNTSNFHTNKKPSTRAEGFQFISNLKS